MTTKPNEKYIEEFIQGIAEIVQKKIESGKATFFVSKDEPHQEPSAEDQLYELKADISNGVGFLFVDALQKKGELYKLIKKLRQSTIDDVVERIKDRIVELEKEAEWLDTRLMNGDWDSAGIDEAMYALNLKTEEDIIEKIGKNLFAVEVLKSLQSQTTVQEGKEKVAEPKEILKKEV